MAHTTHWFANDLMLACVCSLEIHGGPAVKTKKSGQLFLFFCYVGILAIVG